MFGTTGVSGVRVPFSFVECINKKNMKKEDCYNPVHVYIKGRGVVDVYKIRNFSFRYCVVYKYYGKELSFLSRNEDYYDIPLMEGRELKDTLKDLELDIKFHIKELTKMYGKVSSFPEFK